MLEVFTVVQLHRFLNLVWINMFLNGSLFDYTKFLVFIWVLYRLVHRQRGSLIISKKIDSVNVRGILKMPEIGGGLVS